MLQKSLNPKAELTITAIDDPVRSLGYLLRFVSPSLPIGAFAWSQGLESLIEMGWVDHESRFREWLDDFFHQGLGCLDLPVMMRMFQAFSAADLDAVTKWSEFLFYARESKELREQDRSLGLALKQILLKLKHVKIDHRILENLTGYHGYFVYLCVLCQIPAKEGLVAFLWQTLEAQCSVASRLIPLGHQAIQGVIDDVLPMFHEVIDAAEKVADDEIGSPFFTYAMASSWHEEQYSRLFRS